MPRNSDDAAGVVAVVDDEWLEAAGVCVEAGEGVWVVGELTLGVAVDTCVVCVVVGAADAACVACFDGVGAGVGDGLGLGVCGMSAGLICARAASAEGTQPESHRCTALVGVSAINGTFRPVSALVKSLTSL